MGSAEIDRLDIEVEAQATKANRALTAIIDKLQSLSDAVGKVNGSDLTGFANGINKICKASSGMSDVKTADFTRLAKNIERITAISPASINSTSSAFGMMAKQIESLGAASGNAAAIGEIAKNISKLGNKGVASAIDNMPRFATALTQMMTTLSKAPQMSSNLIQMTNALSNLAANIKGTQTATSQAGNGVHKLSGMFSGLSSSTNKGAKSLRSFSQIAGSFYANFFAITRGIQTAWKAVMSSMDYVETFNYWNVALDKVGTEAAGLYEQYGYDSAESYANSFSERLKSLTVKMTGYQIGDSGDLALTDTKSLGLDPEQLMNYQAKIVSVTNAVGLMGETSTNTAKALSMLAADMSSYTNEDLSSVMTNFQSGLIGQSRALYKFGIDITNATLQQYAYNLGVTKSLTAMSQAEKIQLRLIAILDQSKVAWGDQANTLGSVANQYRIMKQQISNLARTIGNLFLPIVKNVLPVINAMVIALNRLFTTLGLHFFGDNWLKELQDGTSKGYSGIDDIGDSADEAADSMNNAANAAKKLKDTTLGIDELNINNPNSDSGSSSGSSSGGGSGIDLSNEIANALADYESVWDKAFAESENKAQQIADAICGAFQRGDYEGIGTYISNGISSTLEKINWESVYGAADNFGSSLAEFFNGLITPELFGNVGTTIAGALNASIYAALSFGTTFDFTNLGESIAAGVNNFFTTFDFVSAAEAVNTWVQGLYETLKTAVTNIDWWDVYMGINEFLSNLDFSTVAIVIGALAIKKIGKVIFGADILGSIASTLGSSLSSSVAAVMASKLGLDIAKGAGMSSVFLELGKSMGTTFVAGFQALFGSKAAESALAFINPIVASITGITSIIGGAVLAVTNFFAMWQQGFSWLNEALMGIGIALAAVGAVILGVGAAPAAIAAAVVAAVATIVIVVKDHWDEISELFSKVAAWFNDNVISPVVEFFRGLWESVSGFFISLWTGIVEIWQTVAEWFSEYVIEPIVVFFQGFFLRVGQIFEGLWIIIQAVWIVVSGWFNDHVITPVVGFFKWLWEKVSGFFSKLWSDIVGVWQTVSGWFNEHVTEPVVGFFKDVWEKVSGFFTDLWSDIKEIWDKVAGWFDENVIQPLVGFFDGLWSAIGSGMVSAMNAIIGGIESAINFIVGGINSIIGGFNKVVSWAAKVAEVDWGGVDLVPTVSLSRISLDGFKDGGFPETGELFMARENGINELVGQIGNRSAVANNDQIVEAVSFGVTKGVADAVDQALAPYLAQIVQNTRETADKDYTANIDGRSLVSAIDARSGRNGIKFVTT
nr:MAG TPA: minor tail protein [Caudoviricetes sp.]